MRPKKQEVKTKLEVKSIGERLEKITLENCYKLQNLLSAFLFSELENTVFLDYLKMKTALDELNDHRDNDISALMAGYDIKQMKIPGQFSTYDWKNHAKAKEIEEKVKLINGIPVTLKPLNFIPAEAFQAFLIKRRPGAEPLSMNSVVFLSKYLMKK